MADKRVIEQTASTELYNDDWFLKDSVVEGTTKISAAKLKELLGADGTQALEEIANAIAEEYDSTHTYSLNDWVFHEGTLYRCIGNNVTGTWNATKWQAKTIKKFIDTAKSSVLSTIEQMLGEYLPISTLDPPSIEAISKGDIFIYQRTNKYKFYRSKADHPQGVTEFDIDDWDEFDTVADLIEDVTENAGKVADVQVKTTGDYETVVENKIAKIDLSSVTAYGEVPNLPQAIATFKDGADAPMKSLKVAIEPQQDLHGYDSPWVGGSGKNKINLADIVIPSAGFVYNREPVNIAVNTYTLSFNFTGSSGSISISLRNGETVVSTLQDQPLVNGLNTFTMPTLSNNADSISFYAGIGGTYKNFMLEVGSQATTYEPYSNICPISGWDEVNGTRTGKNLVESTLANTTINTVGEINVSGGSTTFDMHIAKIIKGETYTIQSDESQNVNQKFVGGFFYDMPQLGSISYNNSRLANTPATFTAPIDGYVVFRTSHNYAFAQIEIGSTATTYEPYNGQTYTIDLDGTRYGGEVDVVNGVLTVDRAYVDLGVIDWVYSENAHVFGSNQFTPYVLTNGKLQSSQYKWNSTPNVSPMNLADGEMSASPYFNKNTVMIKDSRYTSASDFKTAMNGVQLVYELDTPLTIQLTPTAVKSLLGSNNVWADTGDINDCIYQRDINTTINDIIARIEALENA